MYQNTGGYSPITVIGLPHVRHPGELMTQLHEVGSRLVCLTFTAGWCEPCRTLMSQYSDIMGQCEEVFFLLADVDECGGLQTYFRVTMVPTVVLIRRWEVIEMWVGCSGDRLRRRLHMYRDPENVSPPSRRTDLRRIYELIRDDTYMVTDQLREEQWEGEIPGETIKPMGAETEGESSPAWKQTRGLIRGPKSLGLSFAPKPSFPRDKNWRIADAYLTARRTKVSPVTDDTISSSDESEHHIPSRSSILYTSSDKLSKHPEGLMQLLPDDMDERVSFEEHEDYGEQDEEWDEEMSSWRQSEWYRSIYDEWQVKRKHLKSSPALDRVEEGREPRESEAKPGEPRPRSISFVEQIDESKKQSLSRLASVSGQPRGILKSKKGSSFMIEDDDLFASTTWRKMQEEYQRKRSSFTEHMMHTTLEDRNYSRAEVLDLLKRCQRACTARGLDTQYQELVTDVAGQEVLKAKRQKVLQESRARAEKRAKLMATARSRASRLTVTPRQSISLDRVSPSTGSTSSMTQGSIVNEPRKSPRPIMPVQKSNVKNLRQSIAVTAAHRSPASSRASMSSDVESTSLAAAAAARDRRSSQPMEVHREERDTLTETYGDNKLMVPVTQDPEKMLEEVEALRQARESEKEEDPSSSLSSDAKTKEKKNLRARLSKSPKVSFGSKEFSETSLQSVRRTGEITHIDVNKLKTKEERQSYAKDTSTDTTEEEIQE